MVAGAACRSTGGARPGSARRCPAQASARPGDRRAAGLDDEESSRGQGPTAAFAVRAEVGRGRDRVVVASGDRGWCSANREAAASAGAMWCSLRLVRRGAQQAPVPDDSTTGAIVSALDGALALPPKLSRAVLRNRATCATIAFPESDRPDGPRAGDAYGDEGAVRIGTGRRCLGDRFRVDGRAGSIGEFRTLVRVDRMVDERTAESHRGMPRGRAAVRLSRARRLWRHWRAAMSATRSRRGWPSCRVSCCHHNRHLHNHRVSEARTAVTDGFFLSPADVTPVIGRRRDVRGAGLQHRARSVGPLPVRVSGGGLDADRSRVAIACSAASTSAVRAAARSLLRSAARASRAFCRAGSSRWRTSRRGSVGLRSSAGGAVAPPASIRSRSERRTRTRRAPTRTARSDP